MRKSMDARTQRIKPYEGAEPYIFISYAHRDYERLVPILRELEKRGYRFWYDEGIDPGTEWPESIANHLENSSVCLSFISPYSAESKNCRREINFALSRNIALLTVFLEETELSSGLEMQISTYLSIMGYKYPDLPSLMERIVSVDVMEPCRGKPGESAATEENIGRETPSIPKKRRSPLMVVIPLVLAAVIAVLLIWNGSRKEESNGNVSEPGEESASTAISKPILTPEPVPEGFHVLVSGEWEDGAVIAYGDEDKTVRIELTDDRIPYGYPMSEQPGTDEPVWCVCLTFGDEGCLRLEMHGEQFQTTFSGLHTQISHSTRSGLKNMGSFRYTLTGNTFSYETCLPGEYTTQDVDSVVVFLRTEEDSQNGHYFFVDGE